jgi:hypothetical protein
VQNAKLFDEFVRLVDSRPNPDAEIFASNLLENIRLKVQGDGKFSLPFGLVITEDPKSFLRLNPIVEDEDDEIGYSEQSS